jgi:uncharacterized protein
MEHRLALITGATSGIGEALARKLASEGISLILSGTRSNRLREVQADLSQWVSVDIIQADLRFKESRSALIYCLRERAPDLVINNAGAGLYGNIFNYSSQDELDILEVNGNAVLELTLEAINAWKARQQQGVVLNVASAAAFQIIPGLSVYSAAKAFVVRLSESLDLEMQPYGIRVLAACPGMVKTEFSKRAGGKNEKPHWGAMSPDSVAQAIWQQIQRGQSVRIIDWRYRLLTWVSRWVPSRWLAKSLQKSIEERIKGTK